MDKLYRNKRKSNKVKENERKKPKTTTNTKKVIAKVIIVPIHFPETYNAKDNAKLINTNSTRHDSEIKPVTLETEDDDTAVKSYIEEFGYDAYVAQFPNVGIKQLREKIMYPKCNAKHKSSPENNHSINEMKNSKKKYSYQHSSHSRFTARNSSNLTEIDYQLDDISTYESDHNFCLPDDNSQCSQNYTSSEMYTRAGENPEDIDSKTHSEQKTPRSSSSEEVEELLTAYRNYSNNGSTWAERLKAKKRNPEESSNLLDPLMYLTEEMFRKATTKTYSSEEVFGTAGSDYPERNSEDNSEQEDFDSKESLNYENESCSEQTPKGVYSKRATLTRSFPKHIIYPEKNQGRFASKHSEVEPSPRKVKPSRIPSKYSRNEEYIELYPANIKRKKSPSKYSKNGDFIEHFQENIKGKRPSKNYSDSDEFIELEPENINQKKPISKCQQGCALPEFLEHSDYAIENRNRSLSKYSESEEILELCPHKLKYLEEHCKTTPLKYFGKRLIQKYLEKSKKRGCRCIPSGPNSKNSNYIKETNPRPSTKYSKKGYSGINQEKHDRLPTKCSESEEILELCPQNVKYLEENGEKTPSKYFGKRFMQKCSEKGKRRGCRCIPSGPNSENSNYLKETNPKSSSKYSEKDYSGVSQEKHDKLPTKYSEKNVFLEFYPKKGYRGVFLGPNSNYPTELSPITPIKYSEKGKYLGKNQEKHDKLPSKYSKKDIFSEPCPEKVKSPKEKLRNSSINYAESEVSNDDEHLPRVLFCFYNTGKHSLEKQKQLQNKLSKYCKASEDSQIKYHSSSDESLESQEITGNPNIKVLKAGQYVNYTKEYPQKSNGTQSTSRDNYDQSSYELASKIISKDILDDKVFHYGRKNTKNVFTEINYKDIYPYDSPDENLRSNKFRKTEEESGNKYNTIPYSNNEYHSLSRHTQLRSVSVNGEISEDFYEDCIPKVLNYVKYSAENQSTEISHPIRARAVNRSRPIKISDLCDCPNPDKCSPPTKIEYRFSKFEEYKDYFENISKQKKLQPLDFLGDAKE